MIQRTLKTSIRFEGIGLHSGEKVWMEVHPASASTGIRFKRVDWLSSKWIPATFAHVSDTRLATTLGSGEDVLHTVEHFLAACALLSIDNLEVELHGSELPILDGSAILFVTKLREAGLQLQTAPVSILKVIRPVELKMAGNRFIRLEPADTFSVDAMMEWNRVGWQKTERLRYEPGKTDLAAARTFGFLEDVERLRGLGLIKGGSLENAVLIGSEGVMNPDGLRFQDELVRHKVLDALGDLKLAGMPIEAHVTLERTGHEVHFQLLKALFQQKDAFVVYTKNAHPSDARSLEWVSPLEAVI